MIKFEQKQIKAFCNYPFQKLKVDSEGWCTFCCHHTRKCLGNILESSLEEIWNSELAKQIRKETLEGRLHSTCKIESCPFYWKQELTQTEYTQKDFPLQFEIDLPNTHCNIGGNTPKPNTACLMCERANPKFKPDQDKVDEVCEKLKPYTKHIKAIHIQGVAEPFWKNKIFDVIEKIGVNQFKEKIIISTTTNGTILNNERIEKWLSYPLSATTFSLDAGNKETYKKIRKLDLYDGVIKSLMKMSEKRKKENQKLYIHNNINMLNIKEVKTMVEVAADAGVDEINFNPTYNLEGLVVSELNAHIFKKAQDDIIETAERLRIKVSFIRNMFLNYTPLVQIKV